MVDRSITLRTDTVTKDLDSENQRDLYLVAFGAYMRARRKRTGLTHTQAAAAARLSGSQIQKIEAGVTDTAGTHLLLLMDAIGATADEALGILRDATPTAEKGRQLGEEAPSPAPSDRLAAIITEIERDAARDPELLPALIGFLAGRRSRW